MANRVRPLYFRFTRHLCRLGNRCQSYGDGQQLSSKILIKHTVRSFSSGGQPAHRVVTMPALSPTMDKGNIVRWKKKEGDEVAIGDSLGEIETDKATVDFDSPEEGFLSKILVPPGSKDVPVGQPVLILVEAAEDVTKVSVNGFTDDNDKNTQGNAGKESNASQSSMASQLPNKLGPSVRRLLAETGIDVSLLRGTGPRGIIIKGDVLSAMAPGQKSEKTEKPLVEGKPSSRTIQPPAPSDLISTASSVKSDKFGYTDIPITQIRKVIAKRLLESKNGIPHLYLSKDTFLDETLKLRKTIKEDHGIHVSVNDFVIRAVALALKDVPGANAHWDEKAGEIVPGTSIDISIAVATEKGLMTPVLRNADQKSLSAISSEVKLLAEKARQGKLSPQDYQGGSFSISNLGMFPVDQFCAIINPPQACILAVGKGEQTVVWEEDKNGNGRPCNATKMTLTLSADHRVVDADLGGHFLQTLSKVFSDPRKILL